MLKLLNVYFNIVVDVFLILFNSEQSVDYSSNYIVLKGRRNSQCTVLFEIFALKCTKSF